MFPHQGSIFDHVISQDRAGFKANVLTYLYLNAAQGCFGALSGIMFSLVGRKISNAVRNQLFCSIVVQDIACELIYKDPCCESFSKSLPLILTELQL